MFFKKKNTNSLDGIIEEKTNKFKSNKTKKEFVDNKELKKDLKKDNSVIKKDTQIKPKQNIRFVKERFEDFTKIPNGAKILSENEKSNYFIEDALLRENIIILDVNNYHNKSSDIMESAIIVIMSFEAKTKINIDDLRKKIAKENKLFVVDLRNNAKQFIIELQKSLYNDSQIDVEEATGNRKRVTELFEDAVKAGVSDLHISVGKQTIIRARINGTFSIFKEYRESPTLNADTGFSFARTIYNTFSIVSGMSFIPSKNQDALGLIKNVNGSDLRIRIATAPTENSGFDMVMRLLIVEENSKPLTLEQLGYNEKQRNLIMQAIAQSNGATIIAGTTNSGKSTTLQNLLVGEINNRDGKLKVITVEDPPEYHIAGASQRPVVRDADGDGRLAFKNAIKAALRMDPDIIMIGEVRDEQTAELLVEATQTGHKVVSTIHAGSALTIIGRLENLGIKRETLSDSEFISALIYQKLFPVICPHCSLSLNDGYIPVKYSFDAIIIKYFNVRERDFEIAREKYPNINIVRSLQDIGVLSLKEAEKVYKLYDQLNNKEESYNLLKRISLMAGDLSKHNIRFKGAGCSKCKNGIKGRTVVSEVVRPDMKLRELISEGNSSSILKYWKKNLGGKTAMEDSYDKMLEGKLSPIDVEEKFGAIVSKFA